LSFGTIVAYINVGKSKKIALSIVKAFEGKTGNKVTE
jgi:hypothetical protein